MGFFPPNLSVGKKKKDGVSSKGHLCRLIPPASPGHPLTHSIPCPSSQKVVSDPTGEESLEEVKETCRAALGSRVWL